MSLLNSLQTSVDVIKAKEHPRGCFDCGAMTSRIIGLAWKCQKQIAGETAAGFGAFGKPTLRGDRVVDRLQRLQFLGLECPFRGMTIHSRPLSAWGGSTLPLTGTAPVSKAVHAPSIRSFPPRSNFLPSFGGCVRFRTRATGRATANNPNGGGI